MKVWVTGASGLLGRAILKKFKAQGIACIGSTRDDADITDLNSIASFSRSFGPFTHIINCASYTAVDLAESNPKEAQAANALGPTLLGLFAVSAGLRLVHLSTDYVFNGEGKVPYREDDAVAPGTVYGKTKAEGERRLAAVMPEACIIRTSWLFGDGGKNFFSAILDKMKTMEEVQVVADQIGKPTYVPDLVAVLIKALDWSGIYHVANAEATSRLHFTETLYDAALAQGIALRTKRIVPILSSDLFTAAKRPLYSVLDTEKAERKIGSSFRSWRECMDCLCSVS